MRRPVIISLLAIATAFGIWRGLAARSQAAAQDGLTPAAVMSAAELRYFQSQSGHWRQCLLR